MPDPSQKLEMANNAAVRAAPATVSLNNNLAPFGNGQFQCLPSEILREAVVKGPEPDLTELIPLFWTNLA